MIIIAAFVLGALIGWFRAGALGGNLRDRAQYATAHGLIFLLVGVFATIMIDRMV